MPLHLCNISSTWNLNDGVTFCLVSHWRPRMNNHTLSWKLLYCGVSLKMSRCDRAVGLLECCFAILWLLFSLFAALLTISCWTLEQQDQIRSVRRKTDLILDGSYVAVYLHPSSVSNGPNSCKRCSMYTCIATSSTCNYVIGAFRQSHCFQKKMF